MLGITSVIDTPFCQQKKLYFSMNVLVSIAARSIEKCIELTVYGVRPRPQCALASIRQPPLRYDEHRSNHVKLLTR